MTLPDGQGVQLDLGPDIRIDRGDSATIDALIVNGQGPFNYVWSKDSTPYDCLRQDCSSIRFIPTTDLTTIRVRAFNDRGCEGFDEISIVLRDQLHIFIPNVFSPNGDGINDVFMPEAGPDIEEVDQMQIFDRWGNLLFESRNFQPGDQSAALACRKNGQPLSPGVYVYHIEVEFANGQRESIHGTITLVR